MSRHSSQAGAGRCPATPIQSRPAFFVASTTSGGTGSATPAASHTGSVPASDPWPVTAGCGGGRLRGWPGGGDADRGRDAITFPPPRDAALLAVALAAVSTSAPLIAATAAPALAIAFWRNAMAAGVLLPVGAGQPARELRRLDRRQWGLCALAGALLAGHFATWVPSVTLTTVASSTALVATQPVWAALLARRAAAGRSAAAVWVGIGVAVVGVGAAHRRRRALSGRALLGDLLALVGGALAAAYVTAGGGGPRRVGEHDGLHGGLLLDLRACCCWSSAWPPASSWPATTGETWLKLLALTAGAQLLGHSLVNVVLRTDQPDGGEPGDPVRGARRGLIAARLAGPGAAAGRAARRCSCCWSASALVGPAPRAPASERAGRS